MDTASRRIDSTLIQNNQGKLVRIIGKLDQYNGTTAVLNSNGSIPLELSTLLTELELSVNNNYEIIGRITDSLNITVFAITAISDNFNFDNYYNMVKIIDHVTELF